MRFEYHLGPSAKRVLRRLSQQAKTVHLTVMRSAQRSAAELEHRVKTEGLNQYRLKSRTGSLRRSVKGDATIHGGEIIISVGSTKGPASPYSKIQEEGGDVRPKNVGWLTIPQGPALTGAGVPRYKSARDVPVPLTFIMTKRPGVALLIEHKFKTKGVAGRFKAGGGRISKGELETYESHADIWYTLVKRVTLPATKWLSDPMDDADKFIAREMEAQLSRAIG